jgi:hypothetical protein
MEIHSVGFDGCDACDEDDEYADLDDGWVGRPAFTEIRLVLSMRILQQSGMPKVQLMGVLRTVDSQERDRSNRELDWMKCMRKLGVEATECRYCRFMEADKIEAAKHEEKCKQWLIKACRRREVKTGGGAITRERGDYTAWARGHSPPPPPRSELGGLGAAAGLV